MTPPPPGRKALRGAGGVLEVKKNTGGGGGPDVKNVRGGGVPEEVKKTKIRGEEGE